MPAVLLELRSNYHCSMSKHLFIGLELRASCRETLVALDPVVKGVRWLPPEQMHLTLSFLGGVEAEEEVRLRDALAGVDEE